MDMEMQIYVIYLYTLWTIGWHIGTLMGKIFGGH